MKRERSADSRRTRRISAGVLLASVALTPFAAMSAEPARKLAVMPLQAERGVAPDLARQLTGILTTQASRIESLDVMSTADIQAVLGMEKLKDALGCTDISCAAEIGGALGTDLMLSGSLSKLGGKLMISLALYDVKALTPLNRASQSVADDEKLFEAAMEAVLRELFGLAPARSSAAAGGPQGSLFVHTNPPGAQIFLDGEAVGRTPMKIAKVEARQHTLLLKKDGYVPLPRQITVVANQVKELGEDLTPQTGGLRLESDPGGARCVVDGTEQGIAPCTIPSLLVGQHEIALLLEHYQELKKTVTVSFDQETVEHIALVPEPVKVAVTTVPSEATVVIDGVDIGKTDGSFSVTPGRHALRLSLMGYEDLEKQLSIDPGQPITIAETLKVGLSEYARQQRVRHSIIAWTVTGAAVVAASLWAWQGLRARSIDKDLEQNIHSAGSAKTQVNAGKRAALTADISGGATILLGGVGAYLWLTF